MSFLQTAKNEITALFAPGRALGGLLLTAALCCACGARQSQAAPEDPPLPGAVSAEPEQTETAAAPEDPYRPVLDAYHAALTARQAAAEPWEEDSSGLPACHILIDPFWSREGKSDGLLDGVGFARTDLDGSGTEELLLGWTAASGESWNLDAGYFFAAYTAEDGQAVPALEGWERNRYVAGGDGYIYNGGSGGSCNSVYIKYRFDPSAEGYLVPLEGLHSWPSDDPQAAECLWLHLTDSAEAAAIWETAPRPELMLSQAEALALGDGWMASGAALDVTAFSEYVPGES